MNSQINCPLTIDNAINHTTPHYIFGFQSIKLALRIHIISLRGLYILYSLVHPHLLMAIVSIVDKVDPGNHRWITTPYGHSIHKQSFAWACRLLTNHQAA